MKKAKPKARKPRYMRVKRLEISTSYNLAFIQVGHTCAAITRKDAKRIAKWMLRYAEYAKGKKL